nr:AMP-binding protein [Prolixibacteraceae bacterium]
MINNASKIHVSFEVIARKYPSTPAIITNDRTRSYRELNSAAERLAHVLIKHKNDTQEAIGVLSERSADLPVAFLAILKAACVYVPLVADLPPDRLANMAEQAEIKVLVVLGGIKVPQALKAVLHKNNAANKTGSSGTVIRPEVVLNEQDEVQHTGSTFRTEKIDHGNDLAAILFTSGSTGKPKGVMLPHKAVLNMAEGHIDKHRITQADRILLSTSPGFILGFRELCLPLMSGAAYVPVSRDIINNPQQLLEQMDRQRVSIACFTPSYLRLLNGELPRGLRCIITAGERPNDIDARHYAKHLEYWNVHGATEMCGTICMHRVDPDETGTIPSGKPFFNTRVFLLDDRGREVEKEAVGEIYVVGEGLSNGYLKQPELTNRSFVSTPFGRAYRTRDLGRWNSKGELETLGRSDDTIKISGQSVSLSEIEKALQIHPAVRLATAMVHKGTLLAAVECPNSAKQHRVNWRSFLSKSLPGYMIPAHITELETIPIASAGKLDRKAILKALEADLETIPKTGAAPRGELEKNIAAIWEKVIKVQSVCRDDNFFQLGGTSLMAIAVCSGLQQLGYKVTVQTILTELTVKNLAARINRLEKEPNDRGTNHTFEQLATVDQKNFWLAANIGFSPATSQVSRVFIIHGASFSENDCQRAWIAVLERHAALRSAFYSSDSSATIRWKTSPLKDLSVQKQLIVEQCSTFGEVHQRISHWRRQSIDLGKPPLGRAGLIKLVDPNRLIFWFVFHHAVVDGMSASVIQDDYLRFLTGQTPDPVENGIDVA